LPVVGARTKLQPVYVGDVGKAVCTAALNPAEHGGKTYELGGPEILSMHDLLAFICRETGRHDRLVDVPDAVAGAIARTTGWLPGAPITWDQWLMLQQDNVAGSDAKGLKALGITPTPLAAVTENWLTAYRRHGRFAAKSPY
ncbi:MAG TPA: complex I NDUFA9 subunit family protein, partial [Allosphingosinicella sp.]